MSSHVRFEDEADVEYRNAGRWYEDRRAGLGFEFFDAVDATVSQILIYLALGSGCRECPPTCRCAGSL